MFRIAKAMTDPGSVMGYYLCMGREYAAADYYTRDEGRGRWAGTAAKRLNLLGEIGRRGFAFLCGNRHPETGELLTPRMKAGRRIGFDLSFSAPKSLSLLWAETQDPGLVEALREATQATMAMIEAKAATRVRKGGADHDRITGNLVWAEFLHHTARPAEGSHTPDPQLHTHCFVFNATFDPVEERWKALQPEKLHRLAPYFQAAFHSHLSQAVMKRGWKITRQGKAGWEMAGVSKEIISRFSSRTRQIEAKAKELGILDAARKAELGATTRQAKVRGLSQAQLHQLWRSRIFEDEREEMFWAAQTAVLLKVTPEDAVQRALDHLLERESRVEDWRLAAEAMKLGVGMCSPEEINEAVCNMPLMRGTDEEGRTWVTTREVLAEEQAMILFATHTKGKHPPLASGDRVIQPRDGVTLNADQQNACRHVWHSPDPVMMICGKAGVGKTTMIQEAVAGLRDAGKRVVALAPSAEASRGVLREAGLEDADTVAMFLARRDMQEKARDQVIWIDEASLVGSRTMAKVFHIAARVNARVVVCGDPMQHKSVERGDVLRLLENQAGIKPAEINTILRQKGAYRRAVEALSRGDVASGWQQLKDMGAIREIQGEARYEAIAEDYVQSTANGRSALVIAPTHAEGAKVTAAIRRRLQHAGRIDGDSLVVTHQKNLQWTEAERRDVANYEAGQMIYVHRAMKGFKAKTWWQVTGRTHENVMMKSRDGVGTKLLPLGKATCFNVYRPTPLPLAIGDLIQFTQNTTSADGQRRISNGTHARIVAINPHSGTLKLDSLKGNDRYEISANNGLLRHGYCSTSHAAQGKTVDRVIVSQGTESLSAISPEQFCVSASRAQTAAMIYVRHQIQ
ncbi:MAG: MobF family relaxase [Planctomycetota bacterium]